MAEGVLLEDGRSLPPPASPAALLAARRRGAYTTAALVAASGAAPRILDWPLHAQRLASNTACLAAELPPLFAPFLAWCQHHSLSLEQAVAQAVEQQVAAALAQLPAAANCASSGGADGGDTLGMLVVVLTDPTQPPDSSDLVPAGSSAGGVGSGGSGAPAAPPLRVTVYAKWVPTPTQQQRDTGVKVVVRGAPRAWARAKHCEWVLQRRALEDFKAAADADEVVLLDEAGGLLEGLVSNFFVIAEVGPGGSSGAGGPAAAAAAGAGGGGADSGGSSKDQVASGSGSGGGGGGGLDLSRYELQTARNAVLPGIVQARVLQAAAGLGLRAAPAPPHGEARGTWREAFIANCLKGLQPVASVSYWPDGPAPHWEQQLPAGAVCGPVTALLRERVAALQARISIEELRGGQLPQ